MSDVYLDLIETVKALKLLQKRNIEPFLYFLGGSACIPANILIGQQRILIL